jgi:electron transfer flavoprotein alpha subunit
VIAVIPVRAGVLPLGAAEAAAEAGGAALVVGDGAAAAARELAAAGGGDVSVADLGRFAPDGWSRALAPHVAAHDVVLLPASADGRDLAPRLAFVLERPLYAGALSVRPGRVVVGRRGGLVTEEHRPSGPLVATLEPMGRGAVVEGGRVPSIRTLEVAAVPGVDAEIIEVLPPDPATMDLSEAPRIVAGGAGLGGPEPFALVRRVAGAIGASWGASRVAADAGWVPQDRFIGTTGVTIDAELYIAVGISGAVQHVSGLGSPDHIIAVNTDASAPMMAMADLALVTDGAALLCELADQLGVLDG